MKLKQIKYNLLTLVLIFTFVGQINRSAAQSDGFEVVKNLELIDLIYRNLDMYYVDKPVPGKIMKAGIDAMLQELDPYTVFIAE